MQSREGCTSVSGSTAGSDSRPLIVVGVTCAETCLVLKARLHALRSAGFRVVLISSPGPLLDCIASDEGIAALAIPMRREIAPLRDMLSLWRLFRALRRLQPDLTEFSTPKAGLLGNICGLIVRGSGRVYCCAVCGWRRFGAHTLDTSCRGAACGRLRSRGSVQQPKACATRRWLCGWPARGNCRCSGPGSSNGVDVERFKPTPGNCARRSAFATRAPVIGFVGRLTRDKGVPELMEAFELVLRSRPDARLYPGGLVR